MSHIASGDGVVSQLLLYTPVQMAKVGSAHCAGLLTLRLDVHTELNVKVEGVAVAQIGKWLWILRRVGHFEWLQRLHGHYPRTDRSAHVFRQKWPQWNVLPLLNISVVKIDEKACVSQVNMTVL